MNDLKFENKLYEFLYKFNRVFGKIEEFLSIAVLWMLIAVCVVFISARFIFHIPTPWADELARYLLILLGWMGAAYASAHNDHLNIDIVSSVVQKHSKNPEKILNICDRISQILTLVFLVIITYFYIVFVVGMYETGTDSSTLPFEMWVPMCVVIIGLVLVFVHSLCYAILPKKYWEGQQPADSAAKEEK